MKHIHILLCCMMAIAVPCSAQNATSKDFNAIKRSAEYFYYDVTMDKEDAAKNAAKVNLAQLINDYCENKGIKAEKVSADNLRNVTYLQRNTYGMFRVLAYVKKSDYVKDCTSVETAKQTDVSTTDGNKPETEATETTVEINVPKRNVPSPEAAALSKDTASMSLTKWQQDAIATLCKISNAEEFVQKLIDLQNQYKVKRFGIQEGCGDEANSFFALYDSNKTVVALLGPGADNRYDFLAGEKVDLNSYTAKGMKVIWFQLSK